MALRLKPVVYTSNTFQRGAQNTTQQIMLLKAMQITQDPKKLRQMIGVKTVADVYRTLDKMSMRKEFFGALNDNGITFDYVVKGLKDLADTSGDKIRLAAFQTILRAMGIDKYEGDTGAGSGSWEETLLSKLEEEKEKKALGDGTIAGEIVPEYEVDIPEVPEHIKAQRASEEDLTGSIYDPK